jgi:hypothetical protein
VQALNATAAVTQTLEEKVGSNRIAFARSPRITAVVWALLRLLRGGEVNELLGAVQATSSVRRP